MHDAWLWLLLFLAGMALAGLYFGGLWWTVQWLPRVRNPWLLYFGSAVLRLVILLGCLYLLMAGDWRRAVAAVAGFLLLRVVILYCSALGPHPLAAASGSLLDE